jgi:hypothetical protein
MDELVHSDVLWNGYSMSVMWTTLICGAVLGCLISTCFLCCVPPPPERYLVIKKAKRRAVVGGLTGLILGCIGIFTLLYYKGDGYVVAP